MIGHRRRWAANRGGSRRPIRSISGRSEGTQVRPFGSALFVAPAESRASRWGRGRLPENLSDLLPVPGHHHSSSNSDGLSGLRFFLRGPAPSGVPAPNEPDPFKKCRVGAACRRPPATRSRCCWDQDAIRPVGFEAGRGATAVRPEDCARIPGCLRSTYAFPEKVPVSFDLIGLDAKLLCWELRLFANIEILPLPGSDLGCPGAQRQVRRISPWAAPDSFTLFPQRAEPIAFTQICGPDYRVVPDSRRPTGWRSGRSTEGVATMAGSRPAEPSSRSSGISPTMRGSAVRVALLAFGRGGRGATGDEGNVRCSSTGRPGLRACGPRRLDPFVG